MATVAQPAPQAAAPQPAPPAGNPPAVNPNANKNIFNHLDDFLGKKTIYTNGLRLGSGVLTLVVKVAAPALGSALEAIQTLADKWAEVRKWLTVGDVVGDIVGILSNQPYANIHAIQLGVAANAFLAASDMFNPVFLFASVGFFALAPVVGQVLGIVVTSFALAGLTLTIVNAIYKLAVRNQEDVGIADTEHPDVQLKNEWREGLKIASKTLQVTGIVVGVAVELALVTFPYAAIVALVAANIASPALELVRAWI